MKIRFGSPTEDAEFIRYARTRTLEGVGVKPSAAAVEPSPFATYLFAYDGGDQPIGMTETATVHESYGSYDQSPNSKICDLSRFCPPEQMAGMRTVYSEPKYRGSSAIFLTLTLATAKVFYERGTRFATASTSGSALHLHRLYVKYGAEFVGGRELDGIDLALYVFDVEKLVNHRAMKRVASCFAFQSMTV